jgi:hypothetical protein
MDGEFVGPSCLAHQLTSGANNSPLRGKTGQTGVSREVLFSGNGESFSTPVPAHSIGSQVHLLYQPFKSGDGIKMGQFVL